MSFVSMTGAGAVKTVLAVTVSLHPAASHHGGGYTTVRAGDSLSAISQRAYGTAADWPAVWWANRKQVRNPSLVQVGQRLRLPQAPRVEAWLIRAALAAIPAPAPAPAPAAPAPAAAPAASTATTTSDPQPAAAAPAPAPAQAATSYSGAPGSYQACVIQHESGGDPTAVNPSSGAGGLYGFLPSTWQALGFSGLPENASVAEQNAAFQKEYAQSGTAAWSPYDGC